MSEERTYHVEAPIGRGGFGTVYRARLEGRVGFSRRVALKVLNPDMEEVDEVARRLRDEARVLGLVRHRAIVQVDSLIVLAGRWTVVMELIEGVSLGCVVKCGLLVPPAVALEIIGEVAGALHAAWTTRGPDGRELRLLHRDIKPSNIQVTALGEVKVLDFGIARADFGNREAMTRSLAFGTVEYMAPERLDLIDGPAGDVYALGAVLYELLCGDRLGRSSANTWRHERQVTEGLAHLQERLPDVDAALLELLESMLAYDPDQRPSARELERTCARLRSRQGEVLLRDWAEDTVPELVQENPVLPADHLSGSSFMEQRAHRVPTDHPFEDSLRSGPRGSGAGAPPQPEAAPEEPALASAHSAPHVAPVEQPRAAGPDPTTWVPVGPSSRPAPASSASEPQAPPSREPPATPPPAASTPEPWGPSPGDVPPADSPSRVAGVLPVFLLVVAGLLAVGGAVALLSLPESTDVVEVSEVELHQPEAAPPPASAPEAPAAVGEEVEPVSVSESAAVESREPTPPREPATPPAPAEEIRPRPTPTTPAEPVPSPVPAPEPPEDSPPVTAPTGTVAVQGDATGVVLVGAGTRHSVPGAVPPGTYAVEATFPSRGVVQSGQVQIVGGATISLSCRERYGRCAVQ